MHRSARTLRHAVSTWTLAITVVAFTASTVFAQTQGGGGPGGIRVLGGAGRLVSRSGSTLELEGPMGTSKVIVTSSTDYRRTEDTDASAITKGSCVRVTGEGETTTAVAATSVAVLDDAEMCNAQRTTGNRTVPGGASGPEVRELPNGGSLPNGAQFPDGAAPPDGARPQGAFGGITGKVKSVSGDTVTVTARVPKQSSRADGSSNAPPKLVKRTVKVTLTDATTVSHTVDATESVLVVGACLSSEGSTDSVGTVTAEKVTASEPDADGTCTGGFGGFAGPPSTSRSGSDSGTI